MYVPKIKLSKESFFNNCMLSVFMHKKNKNSDRKKMHPSHQKSSISRQH